VIGGVTCASSGIFTELIGLDLTKRLSTQRRDQPSRSNPATGDPDPAVPLTSPMPGFPTSHARRTPLIMTTDPFVVPAVPPPMSGNPFSGFPWRAGRYCLAPWWWHRRIILEHHDLRTAWRWRGLPGRRRSRSNGRRCGTLLHTASHHQCHTQGCYRTSFLHGLSPCRCPDGRVVVSCHSVGRMARSRYRICG
jgi:hypothetical protein